MESAVMKEKLAQVCAGINKVVVLSCRFLLVVAI